MIDVDHDSSKRNQVSVVKFVPRRGSGGKVALIAALMILFVVFLMTMVAIMVIKQIHD